MDTPIQKIIVFLKSPPKHPRLFDNYPMTVRLLYSAAAILALLYITIHSFRYSSIVTDENVYINGAKGVTITTIVEGGASDRAGLHVGDVIVEVNGKPVKDTFEAMKYIVEGSKGKILDYTVLRRNKRLILHVVLASFGIPLTLIILYAVGILFLVIGAFIVLQRPQHRDARLFGYAALAAGLLSPLLLGYSMWYFADTFASIRGLLLIVSWCTGMGWFYHLSLVYPVRRFQALFPRWFYLLIYGCAAALALIFLLVPGNKQALFSIGVTMFLLTGFELVSRLILRAKKSDEYRAKSFHVKVAGIITIVVIWILPFLERMSEPMVLFLPLLQWLFIPAVAIPILFAYPVVKYRLFDLYIVVRKSSIYTFSIVAINILTFFFVVVIINTLANMSWDLPVLRFAENSIQIVRVEVLSPERRSIMEKGMLIFTGVFFIGIVFEARKRLKKVLDKKFHRVPYDYRRALQEFSQLSIRFSEKRALADAVVNDLTALMHLKGAAFANCEQGVFHIHSQQGLTVNGQLAAILEESSPFLTELEEKKSSQPIDNLEHRKYFKDSGVEFVTPVFLDGKIDAVIFLGEKLSETNFSKDDVELLDNLSINVADALITMNFYDGAKEQERLRGEMEIARRIQLSSLPDEIPEFPGLDVAAASFPASEVGGDFFDFLTSHEDVTFLLGDVSGKGTSAALYLARVQGVIRTIYSYQPTLWELFARLNTQLINYVNRQAYLTMAAIHVDLITRKSVFLRAGHLPLLHYRSIEEDVIVHQPNGLGIGLDNKIFAESLEEEIIRPGIRDVFVMLSDGVTEALNESGNDFGLDHVAEVLRTHASQSASEIKSSIKDAVYDYALGTEQHDDLTLVVIKFC